ncbi:protein phosphatase 5 [Aureococcus anophagefferens]|uniref:Serine/threonine-protein phosphatase n=2 Tax=Aureococcus anophagefferens TaxID=44056 RepID=A0ABR1GDL5_AURAN
MSFKEFQQRRQLEAAASSPVPAPAPPPAPTAPAPTEPMDDAPTESSGAAAPTTWRVKGKRGVLVREAVSLDSALVGELPHGALVELFDEASAVVSARLRIVAPVDGWVTARLLEPVARQQPVGPSTGPPPAPPPDAYAWVANLEVPAAYEGPALGGGAVDGAFIDAALIHLRSQKLLDRRSVLLILAQTRQLLAAESTVVDLAIPAAAPHYTVCGDVHGQFYDLLNIFEMNGLPSAANPYVFNGDMVDRGSFSFEVAISLFMLKARDSSAVHLNRGNHETRTMAKFYGFEGEILHKYDRAVLDLFHECFCLLPLGCVIERRVIVVHGGCPSTDDVTLDDIRAIDRDDEPPEIGVFCDLLWSDPQPLDGRTPSRRGVGLSFGPDVTRAFLAKNDLGLLIRSHEVRENGYEVEHGGALITIFSAPNYCDAVGNKGALIHLGRDLAPKFTTFEAVPHPPVRPMAYSAFAQFT